MSFRQDAESPKKTSPDTDEEAEDEESDGPGGSVLGGPEVFPVAAVGGGEEEVLDEHGDEEPLEDVSRMLGTKREIERGLP